MSLDSYSRKIRDELEEKEKVKIRIALFGKSGVGKSTLINKLTGQKLAREGVKTDTTLEAQEYEWNGLHLVDLPGYGTTKYGVEEYISRFDILSYDLFLCILTDRIMADDVKQFKLLADKGKPCIFVRNKHDQIWQEGRPLADLEQEIIEDLQEQTGTLQSLNFVSCRTDFGLAALEEVIYQTLDGAKKERWLQAARAYSADFLARKKKVCKDYVKAYAALSAANGLNPIPGLDIALDIGLLLKLFAQIRNTFGLTEEVLKSRQLLIPAASQLVKGIIEHATMEGITVFLKRFARKLGTKEISKFIPFVGQAISASLGFAVTWQAGTSYLNDCYAAAEIILGKELESQE